MELLDKIRNRTVAFSHDLVMIPVAWLGAYWLRFNLGVIPELASVITMLPIVIVIQGSVFWYFGLYRGVWRFASMPDLLRISKAVLTGVALTAVTIFLLTRLSGVPRSIFPLYSLMLLVLLSGPRFAFRWTKDRELYTKADKSVLIVGAGRAGEMVVRDVKRDRDHAYEPVAFVDDDQSKKGREIHGVRVIGNCEEIPRVVQEREIDLIMIALPSVTSRQMRRIVQYCEQAHVPFRTLPRLQHLVSGKASLKELREVSIEDLLGREPVSLDWDVINKAVAGKAVLVTGGGGSIGAELCRQIARLGPRRLVLLERSEYNLYAIDLELKRIYPNLSMATVLGDVCDPVAVNQVFKKYKPEIVFHSAAYKHVPLLEYQLRTAVINNVLGTWNMTSLAVENGCDAFVMISTDKSVNPGNIMGTTKRVAEMYCQSRNSHSRTRFITVRFGNVLGSAGSVIPLFREQIARGGPVTVTHPEVSRYFMTIPEATQLILQASTMGTGGEIYVLDMGDPIKISYLAEQMIRLSGKQPGEDIEIAYTGLRPGEKLHEELFHSEEEILRTGHPKIFQANGRLLDIQVMDRAMGQLQMACDGNNIEETNSILSNLVPENGVTRNEGVIAGKSDNSEVVELKTTRPYIE